MVLEHRAEIVRVDIADQRWESVCQECRRDDSPKGHGERDAHTDATEKEEGK